jgi:short-subunit dehydrogenase
MSPRRRRQHRLEGKVAVVTGASSGVGRAIARAFAAEGCSVALVARSAEALATAAEEVRDYGVRALVFAIDVSVSRAVDEAADHVVREWGGIDIWVNDAMVSVFSPVHEMTADEFRRVTEVDYLGYVHGTLAALRHMRVRDRGLIMQIGSAAAYRSLPLQSAYCGAKAAIRAFTDSLRRELIHEGSGVTVTMLQLPAVNTPQFEVVRNRLPLHPRPIPPIFQPEVIAKAAVEAALRPRREVWVGWSAVRAIVGQRLIPGLLDRYVAGHAWEAQETDLLPVGHAHRHANDNVDAPLPGDRGAHGPFDPWARSFSTRAWARMYWRWLALGFGALALAGLAARKPLRRALSG